MPLVKDVARGAETEAPPASAPTPPASGRIRLLVALAAAVAFVLGLYDLGHDSFWVDDSFTLLHARLDNATFWHVIVDHEMNGAAYWTLMHGWVRLGQSETWMRLPSVLFVTAAVPVLFLLGRRLFDERVAVTAAFLFAVNAYVVEYSHEARTYGLTLLLTITSVYLLVRLIDSPSRGRWLAWVLVTALLAHAHFFGILVIGAEAVAVVGRRSLPTPRRALVKGFVAIGILLSPIVWFLATGGDQGQVDGAPDLTPVRFVGVFSRLVGNGGPVLLALAGIAIGIGLWQGVRSILASHGVRTEAQWSFLLAVLWVAIPITSIALLSLVKPLFGARWLLLVAPALVLLMSHGVWQITRVRAAQGLLAAIVAVSLVSTALFYPRAPHDDFRSVAGHVLAHAEPGDGIVFLPWFTRGGFSVYADQHPATRDRLDPLDPDPEWGDWLLIDQPPTVTPERADRLLAGHDRVWVVERAGVESAPQAGDATVFTEALAANGYEAVDRQPYPGLTVTLYERP